LFASSGKEGVGTELPSVDTRELLEASAGRPADGVAAALADRATTKIEATISHTSSRANALLRWAFGILLSSHGE